MNQNTMDRGVVAPHTPTVEAGHGSAVSWGAIVAGAAGAGAFSLIMLVLGVGLGMSSVSPWAQDGVSAKTLGVGSIAFLTLTTLLASGLGGYIAGRLRSRWVGTHTDEVYFRDTAHGFLAWAVATLVTAAMLSSTIGAVIGAGAKVVGSTAGAAGSALMAAGGGAAAAAAKSGGSGDDGGSGMGYFVDSLFRRDPNAASATPGAAPDAASAAATTREVAQIMAQSLKNGSISQDDVRYAGSIVAQRAGISQQDAEKRVSDTFQKAQNAVTDAQNKAKEAADKARKASSYASLWLFVTFLIGALAASLAATYGGRRRDA